MEMGSDSDSLAESGGSSSLSPPISSSESLNSLKCGRKIYFEDVGTEAPAKPDDGSGSTLPKKTRGVVVWCRGLSHIGVRLRGAR
jgi:hypothetical protein